MNDRVGKIIEKLVDDNASPEQTMNFILGSSASAGKLEALATVRRLKQIFDALSNVDGVSLELDNWVRVVDAKFTTSPVSPIGSLKWIGGRFNIGNETSPILSPFCALYVGETEDTALNERFPPLNSNSKLSREDQFLLTKEHSYSVMKMTGRVDILFDLRNPNQCEPLIKIISKFRISKQTTVYANLANIPKNQQWGVISNYDALIRMCLQFNWRSYPMLMNLPASSQILGSLLYRSGKAGVIYQSTKGDDACVALFPENFNDDSFIEVKGAPPETKYTRLDSSNYKIQISE